MLFEYGHVVMEFRELRTSLKMEVLEKEKHQKDKGVETVTLHYLLGHRNTSCRFCQAKEKPVMEKEILYL